MFRFERTTDMALVAEVITHPRVYPYVVDDYAPAREEFRPTEHPAIFYVLALDEEELLGMWCLIPHNGICWEIHTYMLPGHGFRRGREAAKAMAEWIWANTPCRRIITNVPKFNKIARKFAEAAGMKEFGVNEMSFQKGGVIQDQVMLGLSRPAVEVVT